MEDRSEKSGVRSKRKNGAIGISDIEGPEPNWHLVAMSSDERAREASEFQLAGRSVEHCAAAIRGAAVAGEFLF